MYKRKRMGSFGPVRTGSGKGFRTYKKRKFVRKVLSTQSGTALNEIKCIDFHPSGADCVDYAHCVGAQTGATGMVVINLTTQGSAMQNRIGNKIVIKSISIKGGFSCTGKGDGPPCTYDSADINSIRYLLVYDKQFNGTYPLYSDILSGVDSTGASVGTHYAPLNISNKNRFVVIRDKFLTIDPASNVTVNFKEFVKKKLETVYKASAGNQGDIATGALIFMWFYLNGSNAYADSQPPYVDFVTRVRYYD